MEVYSKEKACPNLSHDAQQKKKKKKRKKNEM